MAIFANAKSQSDIGLYGLRQIPQSNFSNPAFIPDEGLVIGIPFISSISSSTYSSSFSFDDIFTEKSGSDSLFLNLNKLASQNTDNNFVTEYFENDLIYVGLKIRENYLNFGIRNRLYSRAMYSTDLVKLLWNGNANYINQNLDLTKTLVNHDHFLSYYAGFGFMIGENVSLGIRANLNQGLSSIQTSTNKLNLRTNSHDNNIYSINANAGFLVNTSGLASDSTESGTSATEYLFNFKNLGFSVDFGADIKISERVKINFSVIDLGFINYNSKLKSYENLADSIDFSGIYVDINSTEDFFTAYGDSLEELIDINEFEQSFRTTLPTRIYAGLELYGMDPSNRFSFVFSGTFLKNNFSPAISVGYDKTVSKNFAFNINYSYLKYAPLNLGAGLILNLRPFQFYVLTDNVFSAFKWNGQKYLNFRFGINLIFKYAGKDKIRYDEPVFTK
jgi:hypothetical protein